MIWLILITTVLMSYWVYRATKIDLWYFGILVFLFRLTVASYIEFFVVLWWLVYT